MRNAFVRVVRVAALLGLAGAVFAQGRGHSMDQMLKAGWDCFPVPGLGMHCTRAPIGQLVGDPTIVVKVYDTDTGAFLSTELLMHEDLYQEQPCPQEGAEHWHYLGGPPYYACHHR